MNEEEHTVDKTGWKDGPWMSEPDKEVWVDPETGLDCMIVRQHHGAWCGYVGVKEGHRYFDMDYSKDDIDGKVSVHGGLTYSARCNGHICHPADQNDSPTYWFGFDCAHLEDKCPAPEYDKMFMGYESVYKDINYVKQEVTNLARQLV